MSRAVLSIGSNLGDRLGHLRSVVSAAGGTGGTVTAVSGVYETAPWGPVEQDDFLNAVLVADDPARDARGWLDFSRRCEHRAGRVRGLRWGPRILDVDVVDVGGVTSTDPELTLPHPRAAERAFVLVPWLDADPSARLAGVPVAELVAVLPDAERAGVRRRDDLRLDGPRMVGHSR
jgi:2-amino-4-hydroxy-6-hydroxymethyldihydropteridine diphosphokinase